MQTTSKIRRTAKRVFRWCLVDGKLDEGRARQVVMRVIQSRRRGYLALLAQFERLARLDRARHTAEVESAEPLPQNLQTQVRNGLESLYGLGLNTSFTQKPMLIAGMRIKVGSDVYDGSVRAGLDDLEKHV